MLLRDYLKTENIMVKHFAEMMGTSPTYLSHILKGRRRVGIDLAKKIEQLTDGKVSRVEAIYPEDFEEKNGEHTQMKFNTHPKPNP